jgi:hypothetical protein
VLPLSLVPLTRSDACLDGLTAYRHDGSASSADVQFGLETSLWAFLDVAELAVDQAVHFTSEISDLRARWREQLAAGEALRTSGKSRELTRPARGSSSCFRNTAGHRPTVQRMLAVSPLAARIALEELADAEIVTRKNVEQATTGSSAVEDAGVRRSGSKSRVVLTPR